MEALGLHHSRLLGRRETLFPIVSLEAQGKVFLDHLKSHAYLECGAQIGEIQPPYAYP